MDFPERLRELGLKDAVLRSPCATGRPAHYTARVNVGRLARMKPSIGRIVHFVMSDGKHRPAIIVEVVTDEAVNLTVFPDGYDLARSDDPTVWHPMVMQDETATKRRTWHWPEREDQPARKGEAPERIKEAGLAVPA